MSDDAVEMSLGYRSARKATSIVCGVGITWAAAQFEIKELSVGPFGTVNVNNSFIPFILGLLSIYLMYRATLEYMMQPKNVRRAYLVKLDYRVTMYLVRFNVVVLSIAVFLRTWEVIVYTAGAFLFSIFAFFVVVILFIPFTMFYRMWIRSRTGRRSVANAAIESYYYAIGYSGLVFLILIMLMLFNVINPLVIFGDSYSNVPETQLKLFSGVVLIIVVQFFTDSRFLGMVFATVPLRIERHYTENGRNFVSIEPNPEHPDFEKIKNEPVMKLEKIEIDKCRRESNETTRQN